VLVVTAAGPFIFFGHDLPVIQIVAAAGIVVLSYVGFSAIVEDKRWASGLDWLRIVGLAAVTAWIAWSGWGPSIAAILAGTLVLVSVIARLALRPLDSGFATPRVE